MLVKLRSVTSPRISDFASMFVVSDQFRDLWRSHAERQHFGRRFEMSYHNGGQIFTIPHTNFSPEFPTTVTLTGMSKLGMLDLCLLSTEGNQQTAMLWLVLPVIPVTRYTQYGLVAYSQVPSESASISILSQVDGLVIAGDSHGVSTAIMLGDIQTFEQG